jgi:hypothetical protein
VKLSDISFSEALSALAAIGVAIIATRGWISKYKSIANKEHVEEANVRAIEAGANIQTAGGSSVTALYEVLSAEIGRLTEANRALSKEIESLHAQVACFKKENGELLLEVASLTEQLGRVERLFLDCTTCAVNRRKVTEAVALGEELSTCRSRQAALVRQHKFNDARGEEILPSKKIDEGSL